MYKSYINSFYINQDNTVFTDNRIHKEVTNPQSISNDLHSNKIDKSQIKHTNNIHTHANPNANLSNLKVPNKSNISTLSSQKSNYFDLEAENNNDMVDTNSKTRPIDNVKNSNNLNSNSISISNSNSKIPIGDSDNLQDVSDLELKSILDSVYAKDCFLLNKLNIKDNMEDFAKYVENKSHIDNLYES
eukprot:CAMPEP_0116901120 /NCGR_PEP_ID=MMETSP0467-20121206/9134_1 /TAXON_ID=283647 /ORGANISM="Mesodinium pulex, Strain SPMC105" /LENGTH=187 /DNA_ID=CAMNT_0004574513 /DNA_START=63 /DNA_END=626 /DNA_ORIENTATION=+